MNHQEAKFILRASRPDGQDASDPQVREALELAQRDPVLAQWLAGERTADARVSAALNQVAPPADLRAQILAGARASRVDVSWWRRPAVLAAAAAIAVLLSVGAVTWRLTRPTATNWTEFAAFDLLDHHIEHSAHQRGVREVEVQLADASTRVSAMKELRAEQLRAQGCRAVRFAGREVFEICFKRDGAWFHLYVAPRADGDPAADAAPAIAALRGSAVATWADGRQVYALVSNAGADVLQRVL